jgi:AraC-like DNA-binding protein
VRRTSVLSFFVAMKEKIKIPETLGGNIWLYSFKGHTHFMHRHDELEVNLVTRGTANYLVDGRRYVLNRNTQIWLFPSQDHLLLDQSADYQMWILVFRGELVKNACTSPDTLVLTKDNAPEHFCRPLVEHQAARLRLLFDELNALKDHAPRFNTGLAYAMLSSWAAHASDERITPSFDIHPAVEKAARLIHAEEDAIGIAELGRQAGLSASRLSRLFKQQTGVTLVDYRNKQRLQRFLRLYGQGRRKNMIAAALEAGFGSYPQFHRVFKAQMGYGPAAYRRRLQD